MIEPTAKPEEPQGNTGFAATTDLKVKRTTEYLYDPQGNELEVRHPRFFDTGDANGLSKAKTVMEYTQRNLLKKRTIAQDLAGVSHFELFTYYLDRKPENRTDLRGKVSTQVWGVCCGLLQNTKEPTDDVANLNGVGTVSVRAGTLQMHDKHGNFTWSAAFQNSGEQPADPRVLTANQTVNPVRITTTRYDARHRPLARTVWQSNPFAPAPFNIDPDNVPIAGVGGVAATGLTTCYAYDDDLSNGVTLSFLIGPGPTYTVDLTGLNLGAGAGGSVAAVKNPDGEIQASVRDGLGRVVRTFNGLGHRVTMVHDVVTAGGLLETTIVRQAQGAPLTVVELITRSRADGAGRVREQVTVSAVGPPVVEQIWRFGFDANGNQLATRQPPATSLTDAAGIGEDCTFDNADRRTACQSTRTLNGTRVPAETYVYDASGNQITYVDQLGEDDRCTYDARDRKTSCVNRIDSTVEYRYDEAGNLTEIRDGDASAASETQSTTFYTYNNRGLLKTEQFRDSARGVTETPAQLADDQRSYTYDGGRQLKTRVDQVPRTTTYLYDLVGRLTTRQYGTLGTDDDVFTYDNASRLLTAQSQKHGNTVTFAYDDAGRRTLDRLTMGSQVYDTTFTYDDADRQTTITYPSLKVVTRTYTLRSELDTVSYDGSLVANRDYDDAMRLTATAFGAAVMTETRAYTQATDTLSNLVQVMGASGRTGFTYTYDARGRKTREADTFLASHDQNFTYDTQDRLLTWNRNTSTETQTWLLGAVPKLTKEGDWERTESNKIDPATGALTGVLTDVRTHNAVHEISARTVNSVAKTPLWDAKGNLTNDGNGVTFTVYDDENRLCTSVKGANTTTYKYDALGRRVEKATTGSSARRYIHAGAQVIAEYLGTSTGGSTDLIYVYGDYVDEPLMYATGTASSPTKRFILANHLYSVAAVTNSSGAVAERYRYDAYGTRTVLNAAGTTVLTNGSGISQQVGHTGRYHDSETGLTFFRARYYSSTLGRFTARDSLGYFDGLNLYSGYFVPAGLDPTGSLFTKAVDCTAVQTAILRMDEAAVVKRVAAVVSDLQGPWHWGKIESYLKAPLVASARANIGMADLSETFVNIPQPNRGMYYGWWWWGQQIMGTINSGFAGAYEVECECSEGQIAYVRVTNFPYLMAGRIHFCPAYFSEAMHTERQKTYLHEASHAFAGTYDRPGEPSNPPHGGLWTNAHYVEDFITKSVIDVVEMMYADLHKAKPPAR